MAKKMVTVFDVLNAMPEKAVKLTYTTGGGKQLGKKHGNNAIIEFIVDNETFQDFAFQKTYGEAKKEKDEMYYMAVIFSKKDYDEISDKLNAK